MKKSPLSDIITRGCRANNLEGADLDIPRGEPVVITGVSGSGEGSPVFDALYAEGQRHYVDSLPSYVRQFLTRTRKPECDRIKDLPPAAAIGQRVINRNPRSTVGISSEIGDYLRVLMARAGKFYSPISDELVKYHTAADVVEAAHQIPTDSKLRILVDLCPLEGRCLTEHLMFLQGQRYSRVLVDGTIYRIEGVSNKELYETKQAQLIVDHLTARAGDDSYELRLRDSVEIALYEGREICALRWQDNEGAWSSEGRRNFSVRFEADGRTFMEPTPDLFNFNSPAGVCTVCGGFGSTPGIDPERIVSDDSLLLYEGRVDCQYGVKFSEWAKTFIHEAKHFDFPIRASYAELTQGQRDLLQYGYKGGDWGKGTLYGIDDYFAMPQKDIYKIQNRIRPTHRRGKSECCACHGGRLKEDTLLFTYMGKNFHQTGQMSIRKTLIFFAQELGDPEEVKIAERPLREICNRFRILDSVGLGYLTLDRRPNALSGGESQCINLATRLGNNLVGSMYIPNEPSIRLHNRDTSRLILVIKELYNQDNTVIVVEYDEPTIHAAGYLIDMGLDVDRLGGEVIHHDKPSDITAETLGYMAAYLTGREEILVPKHRHLVQRKLTMHHVHKDNLKGFNTDIPLFDMTVITDVSGSGKSTLILDLLVEGLQRIINTHPQKAQSRTLTGDIDLVEQVLYMNQNSVGRSTCSSPITYVDAFMPIRELCTDQPSAEQISYKPHSPSFNKEGGRCEVCKGDGVVEVPTRFMAGITLVCDMCGGKRFQKNIFEMIYHRINIYDLLGTTVDQAIEFLTKYPVNQTTSTIRLLEGLQRVGLDYLQLEQSSSMLSGDENQCLKLAYYLGRDHKSHVLFTFDEPTAGLHFHDTSTLLATFRDLIDQGHSVLIIECNTEVIRSVGYTIDLGLDGGDKGGQFVVAGTPEEVAACPDLVIGCYLKERLTPHKV